MEGWRAGKVERQDGTSLGDCSEGKHLHPSEACCLGCGTCCSALGCPRWGRAPLQVGSGTAVGRCNLTAGPCVWVNGGDSLGRRASPGWEG